MISTVKSCGRVTVVGSVEGVIVRWMGGHQLMVWFAVAMDMVMVKRVPPVELEGGRC